MRQKTLWSSEIRCPDLYSHIDNVSGLLLFFRLVFIFQLLTLLQI